MASEREGCGLFAFRESGRTLPIVSLYANCGWLKTTHGAYVKNNCERWPADEPVPPDAQAELDRLGMDRDGNQLIDVPEDVIEWAMSWREIGMRYGEAARFIMSLARREPVKRAEWVERTSRIGNTSYSIMESGIVPIVEQVIEGNEIRWAVRNLLEISDERFATAELAKAAVEKRLGVRS